MGDLSGYTPRTRFSSRAADYAKFRPAYPQAALEFIFDGLGRPQELRVADVGAGTGISSRQLKAQGAKVIAIEPNEEMLSAGALDPGVDFLRASAERTALPERSVDLITAFQAFHWFERDATVSEFRRILKRHGRVAAIWNNRNREDPFTRAYSDLIETFGEEVVIIERGRHVYPVGLTLREAGFTNVERAEFLHVHRMDEPALMGYARSCSYLPSEGSQYERLRTGLSLLFARFTDKHGFVSFPYQCVVYRGDLP